MLDQLRQLLRDNYQIDNISTQTNIKTDLGLTSFDFIHLIVLIEDTFGVELEEEKYRSIHTVGELMEYIEKARR